MAGHKKRRYRQRRRLWSFALSLWVGGTSVTVAALCVLARGAPEPAASLLRAQTASLPTTTRPNRGHPGNEFDAAVHSSPSSKDPPETEAPFLEQIDPHDIEPVPSFVPSFEYEIRPSSKANATAADPKREHTTPQDLLRTALSRYHSAAVARFGTLPSNGGGRMGVLAPELQMVTRKWQLPTWSPGEIATAPSVRDPRELLRIHRESLVDFLKPEKVEPLAAALEKLPPKKYLWELKSVDLIGL